ncbi:MAG: hypothetical protein ACYS5V_14045 [Planctomycetota bacterium]|jgi:hypothetical protein
MIDRSPLLVVMLSTLGGCGGGYILTAPDVPVLSGRDAPVVVRLQRREFWIHCPPVHRAPLTFRQGDGPLRCARTDKRGYAAVVLPAPASPGRYEVKLHLQDILGETVSGSAWIYVLSPDEPVVLVDMDSLPLDEQEAASAAEALKRVSAATEIIYLSALHGAKPALAHRLLEDMGCPNGPVLPWAPADPWYRRLPWRKRAPGMLAGLQERIPQLWAGISADPVARERLREAGLKALVVGSAPADEQAELFDSWPNLILSAPKQ